MKGQGAGGYVCQEKLPRKSLEGFVRGLPALPEKRPQEEKGKKQDEQEKGQSLARRASGLAS